MPINVSQMQPVRLLPHHGALAAARLPFIAANDTATLSQQAQALGFAVVGTDQYQHPDGSWLVMQGGRVERGYQAELWRGRSADILQFPQITAAQAPFAAAQISSRATDIAALQVQLQQAGFTPIAPHYYAHADGSFVAFINGAAVRGVGGQIIAGDTPPPPAPPPPPAAPGAATFTPDSVLQYAPRLATIEDGYLACAQLPFLQAPNLATDRQTFLQKGFMEKTPNYFEHPDGSWLAYTAAGTIERGLGQRRFQRNPLGIARQARVPVDMVQHFQLAIGAKAVAGLQAADLASSDKILTDAGFTKTAPNFWRHADTSYVATADGQIVFGVANQPLQGAPSYAGLPVAPVDVNTILQASALWNLDPTDAVAAKQTLQTQGFAETRPGFFVSGTLWVVIEGKQVICGTGAARFQTVPSPTALPTITSNESHKWLAIAQTHALGATEVDLGSMLLALGFTTQRGGFYSHPDGSWVVVGGQNLLRGHQGQAFSDIPTPPAPGTYKVYDQVPSATWDWFTTNTALGRTPLLGGYAQAIQTIAGLGYLQQSTGRPERWQHPDGSWVEFAPFRLGFQKWVLGQLPYNNRPGAV